jgi:hypothetical protein
MRKPVSSRKAREARFLRTFFYTRPVARDPLTDRFLVALDGASLGLLVREAETLHKIAHVAGMIADAVAAADQLPDARERPEVGVEALGARSLEKVCDEILFLPG